MNAKWLLNLESENSIFKNFLRSHSQYDKRNPVILIYIYDIDCCVENSDFPLINGLVMHVYVITLLARWTGKTHIDNNWLEELFDKW